jgi:hypothetical protein
MKEDAIPRWKTDSKGAARLPVKRSGLQLVAVDYMVPSAAPALATEDADTATFVFTSKP